MIIQVKIKNVLINKNVVVNVDAKGSKAQGDNTQANQLGKILGAAVQEELARQKLPGGLLYR